MDLQPLDFTTAQRHIEKTYERGYERRNEFESLSTREGLANSSRDNQLIQKMNREKARSYETALEIGALCFGSIENSIERIFIGKLHIDNSEGHILLIDWRAPIAQPFYRATYRQPLGLNFRWRFLCEGKILLDLLTENFTDPDSVEAASGIPDVLLVELGRARTGQMREIVATIQSEQDEIIRRPLQECVVVQGGPGTGKTAIALHRAAFLFYEYRDELARDGVLIIGPNNLFVNYISQVLPTLGENLATQATLSRLLGFQGDGEELDSAPSILGNQKMVQVIERGLWLSTQGQIEKIEVPLGTRILRLGEQEIQNLRNDALGRSVPWNARRKMFVDEVIQVLYRDFSTKSSMEYFQFEREVLKAGLRKFLATCWPVIKDESWLKKLLRNKKFLKEASNGFLIEREQMEILQFSKPKGRAWTYPEIVLLDELRWQLNGANRQYGHLIVDEAQDRSPMELRAIGRRSATGSMTILGDLAQGTTAASVSHWSEALRYLAPQSASRIIELTHGYRVPEPIMEVANLVLQFAAPEIKPTMSVREFGEPPRMFVAQHGSLITRTTDLVIELKLGNSVSAVVCPPSLVGAMLASLRSQSINASGSAQGHFGEGVAVLTPKEAKGLEFDHVVVVEPSLIVQEAPGGFRALYVALTRSVSSLSVVMSAERGWPIPQRPLQHL